MLWVKKEVVTCQRRNINAFLWSTDVHNCMFNPAYYGLTVRHVTYRYVLRTLSSHHYYQRTYAKLVGLERTFDRAYDMSAHQTDHSIVRILSQCVLAPTNQSSGFCRRSMRNSLSRQIISWSACRHKSRHQDTVSCHSYWYYARFPDQKNNSSTHVQV